MEVLTLSLKREWFDMIKSGVKKEEYRAIKPYWIKRLFLRRFDSLVFTLGYPKADDFERRLVFERPEVFIHYGKPEWGAPIGKLCFVIRWSV